jgi:hypothetical protein
MFGRDWQPARATILARRNIPRNQTTSSEEFIADIQPDAGGPLFRATFRGPLSSTGFRAPDVGDVAPVFCDVKHQKVKFDVDDPSLRWDTGIRADRANFDAVRSGQAVSRPSVVPRVDPVEAEMKAATEAFSAALASGQASLEALSQAKRAGDTDAVARLRAASAAGTAEVQRLNAEIQRLQALRSGRSATPSQPPAAAGDPAERLAKLADLHDRGVLTDVELAAAKAKILEQF